MITTFFLRPRCKATSLAKLAIGAAVAVGALAAGSAQAYVVTVGGVQYDVTTFTGSYNDNSSKFALPPAPGVMPWWGSQAIGLEFADAVGDTFGNPLYYAWDYVTSANPGFNGSRVQVAVWTGSGSTGASTDEALSFQYAQVISTPSASAPAPLPLFGAAAAFGFSRQLRKRIKRAPGALVSGLPRA